MSPRHRALLGAAAGAVAVLFVSPQTRPYLTTAFAPVSRNSLGRLLARPPLPSPPRDIDAAAAYLHTGAERLQSGDTLKDDERRTLLRIARQGEIREPDNPFWPLAEAVFQRGDDTARTAWGRASRCRRYYDHQRAFLMDDVRRLAGDGADQAWMYAAVAPTRSAALILQIEAEARRLMRATRTDADRTELAVETIHNGAMIRDGSERLNLGRVGIAMIERAPDPPNLIGLLKKPTLRLWIAKTALTRGLRDAGRKADAAYCDQQFRHNDATLAFADVVNPDGRFDALAVGAVFADTLPGALMVVSLAGAFVWLFGLRIGVLATCGPRFHGAGLGFCAFALLLGGLACGYPTIGIAAALCALVPAAGPERPRRFDGESLGPLHELIVGCFVLALGTSLLLAATARSLPGRILPRLGELGAVLAEGSRWAAVVVVVLGASAFVAPAWAAVRRFSTPTLAAHTYKNLGRATALLGLALAILAAPVSVALNHWIGNELAEIAQNEQDTYAASTHEAG